MWVATAHDRVTNINEATSEELEDFKPPLMKKVVMTLIFFKP